MIGWNQQRKSHASSRSFGGWVRAHFPEQRLVIEPNIFIAQGEISSKCFNIQNQGAAAEKLWLHISASWNIKLKLRWNHISARTWRSKNCDHISFFTVFFFFNSYALTFCTWSQITWKDFFQVSLILIEQFCSCCTEPHLSLTCPSSWTTNQAKLWTYLWPIGLETLLEYYTENFVFFALYRDKTDH